MPVAPPVPAPEAPVGLVDVAGSVADEAGRALSGVDVYLVAANSMVAPSGPPARGRTGADGGFALKRPEAEALDLVAACPGYRPAMRPAAPPGREHRLVLARGGALAGAVVDDLGRPVAGAMVTARSAGSDLDPPRGKFLPWPRAMSLTYARTLTGADGRFALSGLGEGDLEWRAEKSGWPGSEGFRPAPRGGGAPAEIVLPRPFVAEVCVVDGATGRPAPAVAVRVEVGLGAAAVRMDGRTDADGVARVVLPFPAFAPPAPAATVSCFSERRGAAQAEAVPLAAVEEGRRYTLRLSASGPATVRVRAEYDLPPTDGEATRWRVIEFVPVAGTPVQRWILVNPEGHEVQVPAGVYGRVLLSGQWPGERPAPVGDGALTLSEGETREVRVVLRRGADLRVEVEGEGDPAAFRGKVFVTLPNAGPVIETWHFHQVSQLTDLPPGRAKVRAEIRGYKPAEAEVQLVRGQRADCRLRLLRAP